MGVPMNTYQVEYSNTRCWEHDWRWIFMTADCDEDAAYKAKEWTDSNGYKLIDVKPITGEP